MNETVTLWMFGVTWSAIIGAFSFGFVINNRIDATHEADTERAKTLAAEFSDRAKTLATELASFRDRSNQETRRIEANLCDYKVHVAGHLATLTHLGNMIDRLIEKKYGK